MKGKWNEYYQYIRNNITIAEVAEKYSLELRQTGNDYVCSCIFHNDVHPSMHIYGKEQRFYCYQCNQGGDIFDFVKGKCGCNFKGSLAWLEQEYPDILKYKPEGIPLINGKWIEDGYQIAYDTYKHMTIEEQNGWKTFAKKRGYSQKFMKTCDIFYVEHKKLQNMFISPEDSYILERNILEESQLLVRLPKTEHGYSILYKDYFRADRIIITLRDIDNKIVGYAGRSIEEKDKPKYLYTKGFEKGKFLYRLNSVKEYCRNNKGKHINLYIVEGIFDALRLESKGLLAVATLGSSITQKQVELLGEFLIAENVNATINIFMDGDEAGIRGDFQSLKNLWKFEIFKKSIINIIVPSGDEKDPDEILKGRKTKINAKEYSVFEFILNYFLRQEGMKLVEVEWKVALEQKNLEQKIQIFHMISNMLSKQEWNDILDWHEFLLAENKKEDESFTLISKYLRGQITQEQKPLNDKKDKMYQMQSALHIAKRSYLRENIALDELSWERIAISSDAFFEHLYQNIGKSNSVGTPLIRIRVPKKLGVYRWKSLYIHEELLMQQYVLNELLSEGERSEYAETIPAIRFQRGRGSYVTGMGYMNVMQEPVSFAYQVDMDVINGTVEPVAGMFRPYYECWKEYINYIQEGIKQLESENVYRVKLDIQGFYDNIYDFTIRNALFPSLSEALKIDQNKLDVFTVGVSEGNRDKVAEIAMEWILTQLFKTEFYSPKDGKISKKEYTDCGIPQGPNLSAYIANILLFALDKKVSEIVTQENAKCEDGKIVVRYARYVDDMVIVSSKSNVLQKIRTEISAELYKLNLRLSSKTPPADGISKNEAMEWLLEEKGGLGVSAVFDFADDSLEAVMDECIEYEHTDRRSALRILQSALGNLLFDGEEGTENFESLLEVFFSAEEIRFDDIVRFSELILYHAEKEKRENGDKQDLFTVYCQIWDGGKEYCKQESLLQSEGLDVFTFLEAGIRIIKRQRAPWSKKSYDKWENVEEEIKDYFASGFWEALNDKFDRYEILSENKWILTIKYTEAMYLIDDKIPNGQEKSLEKNIYSWRWIWAMNFKNKDTIDWNMKEDEAGAIWQVFQYCIASLMRIKNYEEYENLRSKVIHYERTLKNSYQQDKLLMCLQIWFPDADDE